MATNDKTKARLAWAKLILPILPALLTGVLGAKGYAALSHDSVDNYTVLADSVRELQQQVRQDHDAIMQLTGAMLVLVRRMPSAAAVEMPIRGRQHMAHADTHLPENTDIMDRLVQIQMTKTPVTKELPKIVRAPLCPPGVFAQLCSLLGVEQ